ncbi:hypothetical protein EV426DRAFT_412985 [Tirmania nivea]|nr:hypothetical protein EV426DRAFT_412985 [Tirmania nivea]
MFELPETKRVRRSDLRSPSFSPPPIGANAVLTSIPADAAQRKLHSLLSNLLPLDLPSPTHSQSNPPSTPSSSGQPPPEDESEYDFPLFTPYPTTSISQPTTHRVTLRTPTPPPTVEDIYLTSYQALAATQHRPLTYYFSPSKPNPALRSCAISGEDILAHARRDKWLGQTYAWRLITVPASPPNPTSTFKSIQQTSSVSPESGKKKKCKPGKKRRIYLRQAALKKEAQKLALGARRQAEAEKKKKEEEESNLKRMLKNRERKAKKRAREKAKKLAGGGGGGAVGGDGAGTGKGAESAGEERGEDGR